METGLYAALDANINRALEGIRVCEDIFRFVVHDEVYSENLKRVRHKITEEIAIFPYESLLSGRDVENDKIKFIDLNSEHRRDSLVELAKKNIHRSIEAMRSIEEFFKLVVKDVEKNPFQEVRFTLYTIEREMISILQRSGKIERFRESLYAILDSAFVHDNKYEETALRLINGGASIIQLRMKNAPLGRVLETAKSVATVCRDRDVVFIINDYPDIACLSEADGVHLGQDDLPVKEVRRILPVDKFIGISTHSVEQAIMASEDEPDYIAIGPIYDTKTKYGDLLKGIGIDVVRELVKRIEIPIVTIGGIDNTGARLLRNLGSSCPAVISYLYRDDRIEDNCRRMLESIRK